MPKRRLIKDPVWGNVELFSWEVELINHFIFNRLHNIVQNSSGYRAYPGLKYSRFLHTIGVTHVVTQLYVNSLINAPSEFLESFRREAQQADGSFLSGSDEVRTEIASRYPCPPEFTLLLAILRMTALLHDIGHLPLSHVFETALEGFLMSDLDGVFDFAIPPEVEVKREQIKRKLESFSRTDNSDSTKTHEIIGLMLAQELATEVGGEISPSLILESVQILRGNKYPIATTFIKGTIDADRIDFTKRDGAFSGLFNSAVDYDRLFKFYTLAEVRKKSSDQQSEVKFIVARPSLRAISESEKLLWERFQDYKYIVVHHKVHLYDEIVENILIRLMAGGQLNDFLDNISYLLTEHSSKSLSEKEKKIRFLLAVLLEFDDTWIENKIRSAYKLIISNANHPSLAIQPLFEAYVEDRKKFLTLFKSDLEFWDECAKYAPSFLRFRRKTTSEGTASNNRFYFFRALYSAKYKLQSLLQDRFKCVVLIGPTDKKVNFGIKDDEWAHFYGVGDLAEFLKAKKHDTMLFNCWYSSDHSLGIGQLSKGVLETVSDFMIDAINGFQGITELPFGRHD